jgi:protein-disulfide isomerase
MKRYAVPLGILAVTIILIVLVALGANGGVDYSRGVASEQLLTAEWSRGNIDSKVVITGYSDFQCPACRAYEPLVNQLYKEYGDRVLFVYRHFPLFSIHPNADAAARASEAAGRQGKFWEMHDMLFENQSSWSKLVNAESVFAGYAQKLGLALEDYESVMASDEVRQMVADDYARGLKAGVNSTPTFFLNGTKIRPSSYDEFRLLLEAALR